MLLSNYHKLLYYSILTLLSSNLLAFQNKAVKVDNETEIIFYYIYNQEFQKAGEALTLSGKNLKPVVFSLLTTDLIWWKTLSSNNENDFKTLETYLKEKLGNSTKMAQRNYMEELLYLNYMARLMAIKNQYIKIIKYSLQINSILESYDCTGLSEEEQNIFEIYKAVFNISKSKLTIIRPQFKYDNIQVLKKYQESANIITKTISCYFLAKVYAEIEKSPKQTLPYYISLCELYPQNKIFRNELSSTLLKIKKEK